MVRTLRQLSGQDLAALRRKAGLTQAELADQAGVSRHAVYRLEGKAHLDPRGWALGRLSKALGIKVVLLSHTTTCGRDTPAQGDGVILQHDTFLAKVLAEEAALRAAIGAAERACARVPCGATTRKNQPCRLLSEPGRTRCKFHGGMSTGPRTPEGRARIAEAQRRRWAAWRAASGKR